MKHTILRRVAATLILLALLLPILPAVGTLPVSAGTMITIFGDKETTIYVSEVYDEAVGQLYNETTIGPDPYFERVRPGDWFTVKVNVEKTGDYHFCFSFGWLDYTGLYHLQVDDGETVTLSNTISGRHWRDWVNTIDAPLSLTEGEHTIKVTMSSGGPNIRALKIAPVGVDFTQEVNPEYGTPVPEKPGFKVDLFDPDMPQSATAIENTVATQFHVLSPFDRISVHTASWNNDLGSLRFELYRWNASYQETLAGTPIASEDYIDIPDNTIARLDLDTPAEAGEYLLVMSNITENKQEEVGVWIWNGASSRCRTYKDDAEYANCVVMYLNCLEDKDDPYGTLSPAVPDMVPIEQTDRDLYTFGEYIGYKMEEHSRYGLQFRSKSAFGGVEVYIPTVPANADAHLTLSLYDWKDNFATSVKGTPVATRTVKDIQPFNWVSLNADLPAGEYLLVLEDGVDRMTVAVVETATDHAHTYMSGSRSGISLVGRLIGDTTPGAVSTPAAQDFITNDAFTWVGTDGLDRVLPTQNETGGVREDKYVGIFYHTWHFNAARSNKIINATEVITKYPEAKNDYNHPAWQGITHCFWNEPIWGYYNNGIDRWVLRKQAELLADAGVDVVFFDCTNNTELFLPAVMTLCEVWSEARADGVKTPQISYLLNIFSYTETAEQLITLYDEFYSKGLYEDLWFYWEGKPLMMGYPEELRRTRKDVLDFFSYRPANGSYTVDQEQILESDVSTPSWWNPPAPFKRYTQWKWISIYPQEQMKHSKTGEVEQMCVCVAQNWSAKKGLTAMNAGDMVFGRGYTNKYGINTSDEAVMAGLNIAEQWEYALEVDPTFIFITGWNEWTAGRYPEMWSDKNALPDNATDGYSRDIEPSTGMLKDHFYNQMASYIRRFKGIPTQASSSGAVRDPANIDWSAVTPVFRAYEGNTLGRDADGYVGYHYTNTTGRNDFVESRVTYDAENVYFMVKTAEAITPHTDKAWMRLFIDVAGVEDDKSWETFEYMINRETLSASKTTLERSTGGWNWETVTEVDYKVDGDTMVVTIPRAALGIGEGDFTVNFKWSDNMQADGDIMDFYTNGDVAPGARYKYSFTTIGAMVSETETTLDTDAASDPAETEANTVAETSAATPVDTQTVDGSGCGSVMGAAALVVTVGAALTLRRRRDD